MPETIDRPEVYTSSETDLVAAVTAVLAASTDPLTLSKIRALLPLSLRSLSLQMLADCLHRQVAANVLTLYPKYRSQQDRFWDRPMEVHLRQLLANILAREPLSWAVIRRKLPAYAKLQAASVLEDEVARGKIHRHPRLSARARSRFGLTPADPKEYLRTEFAAVFKRLENLGFTHRELRASAAALLNEDEESCICYQDLATETSPASVGYRTPDNALTRLSHET